MKIISKLLKSLRAVLGARSLQRVVRRWRQPSAAQLLELANRMRWEINPPEDESPWWVIYDSEHQIGGGIATGKTLREALESGWVREEYIMGRASNAAHERPAKTQRNKMELNQTATLDSGSLDALVMCVGDGSNGSGCGEVKGKSGYTCHKCGGMLLSKTALADAVKLAEMWANEESHND